MKKLKKDRQRQIKVALDSHTSRIERQPARQRQQGIAVELNKNENLNAPVVSDMVNDREKFIAGNEPTIAQKAHIGFERPIIPVDPEMERQMAAKGVEQSVSTPRVQSTKKASSKRIKKPGQKKEVSKPRTLKTKRKGGISTITDAGAFDQKGDPIYAAPEDNNGVFIRGVFKG